MVDPVSPSVEDTENKENVSERPQSQSKPSSLKSGKSNPVFEFADNEVVDGVASPDAAAADNPAADMRYLRRIIAEDPEWNLTTVPCLVELCLSHIINNFEFNSDIINNLQNKQQKKVLDKIATDMPLKVTAHLISDEDYWKRCCHERWNICDVSRYDNSWKRMYFERNLEEIIEMFVPDKTDMTQLVETLPLSAPYVQRLNIRQLLPPVKEEPKDEDYSELGSEAGDGPDTDHFDFTCVLPKLPNLVEFRVAYGVRDCGMNFEWSLFNFTARDCLLLAKVVASCQQLKVFQLHRSRIDCDKCRVLISHLLNHPNLIELDFSHNTIGDRGARALGKFINGHSKLVKMSVADNLIRARGAQAIAHALTKNTTLTHLNMRLNRLGDDGGQAICKALLRNSTLVDVNLAANEMTEPTAAILSQVVVENTVLTSLDLSNNRLGQDGGKQLQEGMEKNFTIIYMDLRFTDCGQESEFCINQIIERNQEKHWVDRTSEDED